MGIPTPGDTLFLLSLALSALGVVCGAYPTDEKGWCPRNAGVGIGLAGLFCAGLYVTVLQGTHDRVLIEGCDAQCWLPRSQEDAACRARLEGTRTTNFAVSSDAGNLNRA